MVTRGKRRLGRFVCVGFASVVATAACVGDQTSSDAGLDAAVAPDATPEKDATAPVEAAADVAAEAAAPVHADVAADFSKTSNPNGAWTYGYSLGDPTAKDAGALVVFSDVATNPPEYPRWYDATNVVLDAPSVWRNDSNADRYGVASGEVAMHPGNAGEFAVIRWTAPVAGTYSVMVQFKTGDTGDTNGLLLHDGVALVTEDSTSTDAVHELDVTLAAGDHLDVAVGPKGSYLSDTTPVHFTIQSAVADH